MRSRNLGRAGVQGTRRTQGVSGAQAHHNGRLPKSKTGCEMQPACADVSAESFLQPASRKLIKPMNKNIFWLFLAAILGVQMIGVFAIPLMDIDAAQYASISREMLERKSYLQFLFRAIGLSFLPEYNDLQFKVKSKIDDKNYLFEGKINLKDFYRVIDVDEDLFEIKKGEAETLAGFILEILGNFPKKDQKIAFENCLFTIETVDKKRVKQIKVTIE